MNLKERIQLEKEEFQKLKKNYSFKNIQRIEESEEDNQEDIDLKDEEKNRD